LKNLTKFHLYGLLLGLLTITVFVPVILAVYKANGSYQNWSLYDTKSKIISLASILNLGWFHWFLKKKKTPLAMGIIMATFVSFFVIVYLKFIAH
jgi:hypothetical protein